MGKNEHENSRIGAARLSKIRSILREARVTDHSNAVSKNIAHTQEDYRDPIKLNTDLVRAEVRKAVAEAMYQDDRMVSLAEQRAIEDRQINKYYTWKVHDETVHGHVDAVHGTMPKEAVREWHSQRTLSAVEPGTAQIARGTCNYAVAKKPRTYTDINRLSHDGDTEILAEGGEVLSREYNLNAVKAQRDATRRILEKNNGMNEHGELTVPHLAIYVHGKTDKRGHDFEIAAARQKMDDILWIRVWHFGLEKNYKKNYVSAR